MSGRYYFKVDKSLIQKCNGDLSMALWYSALVDYAKRFRPDETGYTRVSIKSIIDDLGFPESSGRMRIWRLNQKLEDEGYIAVDKVARGGRRYMGFKVLKKVL